MTGPVTAATMRLDGGHVVLDLVNTVYGQVDGPVEVDVLARPDDLVTFARRVGFAGSDTRSSVGALRAVVALRDALDRVVRAVLDGGEPPLPDLAVVEKAARSALRAGRLKPGDSAALGWSWPADDPMTPVHRLAYAATELLGDEAALARLRCCAACRWLFLDRSRGPGRRWCSMADCGTEAKKRRYVQHRRDARAADTACKGR